MRNTILLCFLMFSYFSMGQDFRKTSFSIKKSKTVTEFPEQSPYLEVINNLEMPLPDGSSTRSHLMRQKIKSKEFYGKQKKGFQSNYLKSIKKPIIGDSFAPYTLHNGTKYPVFGGIPSDNTLAISNEGILLLSMNSTVWAYDMNTDSTLFDNQMITLKSFAEGISSSNYYDPKLAYDPVEDRFVLALLKDSDPAKNEIIMCFSSTNDPRDPWYIYNLPGNPLNNNRWTDFPTISITNNKVYFTGNLIVPNEPWQTGFDGSIIWEMDKSKAFSGDTTMQATLYDNITYDGNFIRNLHLVTGANGNTDRQFLLSNRNFDIQNDTIFFLEIDNGNLNISPIITDIPYGVPPNARQTDTDTSDATSGLQTNDGRVLGGILFDDEIQFVSNTIDPATGFCAVYHGLISNIYNAPTVSGRIIGDTERDFGYPNIAWSGNEDCDREVIIGFNHSSFTDFPGNSAVFCNNERQYSPVLEIKAGANFVNRLNGSYERWGDYYGLQRKYNTGEVYSFGYLALESNRNSGFLAQLYSPDTSRLKLKINVVDYSFCDNTLEASTIGGVAPFEYSWNDQNYSSDNKFSGACTSDTIKCVVKDARGCFDTLTYVVPPNNNASGNIFPNPTVDQVAIQFNIDEAQTVYIEIYDAGGRLVKKLETLPAKKGLNEYVFSMRPLANGVYTVQVITNGDVIQKEKIIKQ